MDNKKVAFIDIIKHLGMKKLLTALLVLIFFVALLLTYNSLLYNSFQDRIVRDGELRAVQSAERLDLYLSSGNDALKLSEYTLDSVINEGYGSGEIFDFLNFQTTNIQTSLLANTTGLYAYVEGSYYDPVWTPDEDYVPTERPWYIGAQEHKGEITVIDPYLDISTGDMVLTLAKTMKDPSNVIALDLTLGEIQTMIESDSAAGGEDLLEMMLDSKGTVVAHTDKNELGKNYMTGETGSLSSVLVQRLFSSEEHTFELSVATQRYIVYAVPIGTNWYSVTVINATKSYNNLSILLILSIVAIIATLLILGMILISTGRKELIAERLNTQLSSSADIYMTLLDIDLLNDTTIEIKNTVPDFLRKMSIEGLGVQEVFKRTMENIPESPTKQPAIDFVDLSTLNERLANTNTVTIEYLSHNNLWCRGRFSVSERAADGTVTHVLWMLENIDEEKRARDNLTEKAEKLSLQLSSAADIYISLCDLDIINNEVFGIRNRNPAIEKVVNSCDHNMQQLFFGIMNGLPDGPTKQAAIDFADMSNIDERMKETNTVTLEYVSYGNIWVRARYVVSERTESGKVSHVLWMLENIDKEKRERDKLISDTEKMTKQLAAASDIYIVLYDLDIANNRYNIIRNNEPVTETLKEKFGIDHMQEAFFEGCKILPDQPTLPQVIDFYNFSKIDELLDGKNTATIEYIYFENLWVRSRYIVSERDNKGKVTRVLWMLENIDEEKRTRDKLVSEAEKMTRQIVAASDIYIALLDLDIINDSFTLIRNSAPNISRLVEQFGTDHLQEAFFDGADHLPEHSMKQAAHDFSDFSKIDELLDGKNTATLEYISIGNIWVRGRYVVSERTKDGKVAHVLWMLENIDEEKRARDKLSAMAEKLTAQMASVANIFMGVYDFDIKNDTFSVVKASSDKVQSLVGDRKDNAQQTLYTVMNQMTDEKDVDKVIDFLDLSTVEERLGDMNTVAIEYLSVDKRWRRGRFISSERGADRHLTHVLWLVEDIDKERKDREKLIDMSERAIAASEAKSAFLSNMSHEIRTPINAVLGMNEMVLRECSDPSILQYSESIRTAGTTLLGIINDILDFSKIEAGKMEIIPVDYDLASALNDLVSMIETRAEAKGLMIIPEFDQSIPHLLFGDEVRIKQVITNILTNAVKYTEKGSVTFKVTYEDIPEEPDNIMLKIAIKDTGIGIKKEDMKKLFSEFERIEEKRNRTIEGTGLGMSITKSLLSMMGSHMEVESVYGQGSVFSFSVKQHVRDREPLGDYAAAYKKLISAHKKYKEKFTAPDAHVLVVDDTAMNLIVFQGLLKKTEVQIDTADSGEAGIVLAMKNKYDMIFLDHMMPRKDGIETLKEIKAVKDGPNADTPTICLTANAINGAREMYLEAGFDDYLTKPVESAKLEEMMGVYLPEEKIKPASETSDTAKPSDKPAEKITLPEALYSISELDIVEGVKNTGSAQVYLAAVRTFADTAYDLTVQAEECWVSGDVARMTRKLHILGSAAQIIGANWIRSSAFRLEIAGSQNDKVTVNQNIEELMFRCRTLAARLSSVTDDIKNIG